MTSPARPTRKELEDRRSSGRVPFASVRGVAEYKGSLPDNSEFRPVKGRDLSQTGIAFGTTHWPTSDSIVVMLGDRENPYFAMARIIGCLCKFDDPNEKQFEVRCEFEKWLV